MTDVEISLARAYLAASDNDPITALMRSVRDLAQLGGLISGRQRGEEARGAESGDGQTAGS